MNPISKLATGISGLDQITHGGLPQGRTTLIAGKSGTAKSILALQLACQFARNGVKTTIFTVEETAEDMAESGNSLDLEVSELIGAGRLQIVDLSRRRDATVVLTGDFDIAALSHRIDAAVKDFGAQAVVLDSATALFSPRPPEEHLRNLFFHVVDAFRRHRLTALVTAEAPDDYGPRTTLGVEDFVCDAVIVLRNLADGERRRRTLEVHKYRRSGHQKGEYPFTITNRGVVVFPFNPRNAGVPSPDVTRFSSGLAGLDDMTAGGWLRDSITLVRGPPGCGKTTLAGMYARAGALRGERVAYYGFEETDAMLLRNYASLGIPMEEYVRSGLLRLECRYPESTSPEDLLVDLRKSLAEHHPSLIVLDSISSVAHSTSTRGFRQFMVGFAALVREHSRSALLTQTLSSNEDDEARAPYLSTITDSIIDIDYGRVNGRLQRTISVVKMRGSKHSLDTYALSIVPGGLEVKARA